MLKIVVDEAVREDLPASLDEIAREGARRMLAAALEDDAATSLRMRASGMSRGGGWWCVTGMPGRGR